MTTIDKTGKIVSQVMENYVDRKESDIFAAIAKQINEQFLHLKGFKTFKCRNYSFVKKAGYLHPSFTVQLPDNHH